MELRKISIFVDDVLSQVGVSLGHLDRAVTQQLPNVQQRRPICHTPTGEGVSQVMNPKISDIRAPAGRGKRSLD